MQNAPRILCVDDDKNVVRTMQYLLANAGYVADYAEDGGEALKRISSAPVPFDLIITDHEMPTMGGLSLVQELRKAKYSGAIIVHSSALRPGDVLGYREQSVYACLAKPASVRELLDAVRESLERQNHE